MKTKTLSLFAVTAPGLEATCAKEVRKLGLANIREMPGGVEFCGDLSGLYRANLWLRSASRILARLGSFRSRDFPRLYQRALRLPWGRYVKSGTPVEFRVTARRSRLVHTRRIAETVSSALNRALGRSQNPEPGDGEAQLILVRLEGDECSISVDTSGALLHRRGYRREAGPAPLRETLAAGLLMRLGWDGSVPLCDPFCGSGTIAIEAAMLAAQQPPGAGRSFAFMGWPRFRPGLWQVLVDEAVRNRNDGLFPAIDGSDRDAAMVEIAGRNAQRAGVAPLVKFRAAEVAALSVASGPGLVFCNPPYGTRLGSPGDLEAAYRELGRACRESLGDWQVAFLCPDPRLAELTGLPLAVDGTFSNGGLDVQLYRFDR